MTPTPPAASGRDHPQTRFREVTSETLFDVHLAPGESVTQPGTYVLDTELGAVRGILKGQQDMMSPNARFLLFRQFLPEDGASAPVLYDQTSKRAFTWDDRSFRVIAGSETNSGPWLVLLLGTHGLHAVTVLDSDLALVRAFVIPPGSVGQSGRGGPTEAWASPDGRHLLLYGSRSFHILGLADGRHMSIEAPAPPRRPWSREYGVTIFPSGDGFGISGWGGLEETCRVMRYDWAGALLSDVTIPCAFDIETEAPWEGPHLSPDGKLVAATTMTEGFCDCIGLFRLFTAVAVFDATTGEELFRIRGATWALPHFRFLVDHGSYWLADTSGVVVDTVYGKRVVSADGAWMDLPATALGGWLSPSPETPSLFLTDPTTVVDNEGNVVAAVSVAIDTPLPEGAFVAVNGRWGATSRDVLFSADYHGPTSFTALIPILPPVIERPPFEERLLLRVATLGECLESRGEPQADSPATTCLRDGSFVEAVKHGLVPGDAGAFRVASPYTARSEAGCEREASSCIWIYIRTEDGVKGWVLSDDIRWAKGEPPPDSGS
ncbi:MAG: hypothetical protein OXG61_06405 [Chloroflexi bacterium]|nr:hypothetical protein [Chloroflexota bacterium]